VVAHQAIGQGHLLNPINGTEKWVINIRDRNQRGFSCLFDD